MDGHILEENQQFMAKRPLVRLSTAALVGFLIFPIAGCKEEAEKAEKPTPVRVATVVFQPVFEPHEYVGTIKPRYQSDLGFRVTGKIIERRVNVGDRVKAGDLIARLDATDLKLGFEAQDAELSAAKSSRDQAVAAEQRFRILQGEGHVAQAALDERVSAADEARARVARAERSLEMQRNQVAYAELHADKDGVVSALLAEAGQVVAAGQTIVRVARLDELEAVVAIPEQKLNDTSASRASVSLWPSTGQRYEARLREISPQADPVARTFEARFSLLAPDDQVGLGKTATVTLVPNETRSIARLPLSAVMNDATGPMVWVVSTDGEKLERRAVAVDSYTQDSVLIASGLKAHERVVTLGVHRLDPTMPVRIVETRSIAANLSDVQQR